MKRFVLCLFGVVVGKLVGQGLSPEESIKAFQLESCDLQISLVAAEPQVVDPVAMCFDEQGRMYVVENRGYPNPGKVMPKERLGVVARLEDVDGDGLYEKRTTFATGFTFPNGILSWKNGFFLTDAQDVYYLEDTNDDGVADMKEVVLTGFFTNSSSEQLRVASPTLGPDGWIYLTSGLTGGKVISPKHPDRPAVEAKKNDWRFHPETFEIEVISGVGQVGQTFDKEGRRFVCDNRHPIRWVVFPKGHLDCNPNIKNPGEMLDLAEAGMATPLYPLAPDTTAASFIPKLMHRPHAGSFTSCCGLAFYSGDAMPNHRGSFFICEPAQNLVHCRFVEETDQTFSSRASSEGKEFLASPDQWFRPVFATNGPDGALYICDMYRKYIDHPNYLPKEAAAKLDFAAGKKMGRIWKITSTSKNKPHPLHQSTGVAQAIEKAILSDGNLCELADLAAKHGANSWLRGAVFSASPGKAFELLKKVSSEVSPEFLEEAAGIMAQEITEDQLTASIQQVLDQQTEWMPNQQIAFLLGFSKQFRSPYQDQLSKAALKSLLPDQPEVNRVNAIRFIKASNKNNLLLSTIFETDENVVIQNAALQKFFESENLESARIQLSRFSELDVSRRTALIDGISRRRNLQVVLLESLEQKSLPLHSVPEHVRRRLNGNSKLKTRATKLFETEEKSDRMKVYLEHKKVLELKADAEKGKPVYEKLCASCHRLGNLGYDVGPDLSGLRNQPEDALLLHILVPNKEVYPTFSLYTAETKGGQSYAGVLSSENVNSISLTLPLGQKVSVNRSNLKSLKVSPHSLMPDGLEKGMKPQELANLMAFLKK